MATKNNVGGFKQMPKMETTEPSVILKMKKGGHVNTKHLEKGEHGHMPMTSNPKYRESMESEEGNSPKKPSMSERKKAMNPNFKDGGKVAHKAMGGMMANPQAMAAMANPAIRAAMAKRAMAKRAMMNQNASMAAPMAAPAMGAGLQPGMKKGGKAGDMAQDKAMIKKAFKQHDMQEHKGGKGTKIMLKSGGAIQGGAEKYAKTMMHDGDKNDNARGTGNVKMGNAGGYAAGGTIEGNESKYVNTKMHDGDKNDSAKGTGGVRMGNAGGYAKGGDVSWENRPADTAKPGKVNTTTGQVRNGNAGGYKAGGNASKKAYATGGTVNSQGKAVKMPAKPVSRPVANNLQSGTFAEGGSTNDKYVVKDPKAVSDKASRELEDAMNPLSMAKELYTKGKDYFTTPAGSVTKTEKSVTVTPSKKRGGKVC
jgi:hypothetical protein